MERGVIFHPSAPLQSILPQARGLEGRSGGLKDQGSRSRTSLEHHELGDEHFINDVHDPIISAYIGHKNMGTIDLDAFLRRCRHRILNDISIRVTTCSNFFFSQGCLIDVRPHSDALSLQGFEKNVIKHVVGRIEPRHDMILEQFGQFARVTQKIGLLVVGQLVEGGIGYTILSYSSAHPLIEAGRIRKWSIVDPTMTRSLVVATSMQRPVTKAARALVGFVRKQVDMLVEEERWAPKR